MKQKYFLFSFLFIISFAKAQISSDPDPTFDSRDVLPKLTLFTREFAAQPDGKIVVVGNSCSYTSYNDILITPGKNIIRLNKDLSVDETFNIGTSFDTPPRNLAIQPDGKILVCGDFARYNGKSVGRIVRLNNDGSLDNTFSFSGASNIKVVKILANGKILAGGSIGLKSVARLNSDGTFDQTFNQTAKLPLLYKLDVQKDGKIIIVGASGRSYSINRINADGSTDTSFKTIDEFESICVSNISGYSNMDDCKLAIQSDDKILFGGCFNIFKTSDVSGFIRFNADGTLDKSFKYVYPGTPRATVKDFILFPNDKILTFDLISVNTDGSVDPSQIAKLDANTTGSKVLLLPNNELLICSNNETRLDGRILSYHKFIKVDLNTSKINEISQPSTYFAGNDIIEKPNGDIVVLGYSNTIHNTKYHDGLKLLDKNGKLITNSALYNNVFGAPLNEKNYFKKGIAQQDGKIIVFKIEPKGNGGGLIRYNADFTIDKSFPTTYGGINNLLLQPDGKIVVIKTDSPSLIRLNADGSKDITFNKIKDFDNICNTAILQPDGKIVAAGNFTTYDGIKNNKIVRFNTDGTLDNTFQADPVYGNIHSLGLQSDGKIIVGGKFELDEILKKNCVIKRLNTDGTVDKSFKNYFSGIVPQYAKGIVIQPDNKIIFFTNLESTTNSSKNDFKRLLGNGEIDNTFDAGDAFDGNINTIKFQKDGSLLVTGNFTKYKNTWVNGTIRLLGNKNTLAIPDFELNDNKSSFILHPNPASNVLNIEADENISINSIEIFNILGQSVLNLKNQKTFSSIDISGLNKGIYFIRINSNKEITTKKFFKN
ncbi:putative delta-60 repeat protein [Flavobacterium sp. 2755]|uniref:T9SS type A sorting domain-containing protein n=1 Tax=Flavobacterium sp. 2755 TaxID=2817765 RepID=UPI0028572F4A|nr:T9SS type A sorting domain-containing protein [Flavobacterium sp. 2755]MDR6761784.1 putative delta-60 repeat protein [Flavobacterium sp. 2755]